jgi:hypothetical protein
MNMAIKKYLSLDGLSEYDALVKEEISKAVGKKANSSHAHVISDISNLQIALDNISEEVDGSIKSLSVSGKTITYTKNNGSTGTITTQDTDTDTKVTNTLATTTKAYVTGTTSGTTNTGTLIFDTGIYLDTTAGQLTATTFKGSLSGNATSATKASQDGNGKTISSTYETKSDASAKLTEAKTYADSAAAQVRNDLLNGAGGAYDTLKELGDLINNNVGAIDALEAVASQKADINHTHSYAGSPSAGGAATSANKLNTNAGDSNTPVYFNNGIPVACTSLDLNTSGSSASCTGNAATATNVAWSGVTSKPSYYDAKAIKSIARNGTTFTYTCMDGTTGTFTQQDNNTTYSVATTSANGLMSSSDKTKFDTMELSTLAEVKTYLGI